MSTDTELRGGTIMNDTYRLLLEKTARIHERHEAGRRQDFNVFSVLRSEHDEVNLHSRFLTALLDHRQSPGNSRDNLADFLHRLNIQGFDHNHASVDREWRNIDIVVRDDRFSGQAVVIENKIGAADQHQQIMRYAAQMDKYKALHILYLTLDGREASEDSAGDVEYECISYKSDLVPWLKGCQMRAFDEPAMRESIAQYLQLVAKLTGTNFSENYMNDLKELLLKDDKIVLVHDLGMAMEEAKISLLEKLWGEIECELRAEIPGLPDRSDESDITKERIRKFVTARQNYGGHGLYFDLNHATLCVEVYQHIFFGVYCTKRKVEKDYLKLAKKMGGWDSEDEWPLFRHPSTLVNLKYSTRDHLALLAIDARRQGYVAEVVSGVRTLWDGIRDAKLFP